MNILLEAVAKATYEQRMRSFHPGFDERVPLHARLGMGHVLGYDELPEGMKEHERLIAQEAIDKIKVLKEPGVVEKLNVVGELRDPDTVTNKELLTTAFFSSNPIITLLAARLEEAEKTIASMHSVYTLSLQYLHDLKEVVEPLESSVSDPGIIEYSLAGYPISYPDLTEQTAKQEEFTFILKQSLVQEIIRHHKHIKHLLGKKINFLLDNSEQVTAYIYKIVPDVNNGQVVLSGMKLDITVCDMVIDLTSRDS